LLFVEFFAIMFTYNPEREVCKQKNKESDQRKHYGAER
jgi:hypothetical protein